jgi:hypothetical protein
MSSAIARAGAVALRPAHTLASASWTRPQKAKSSGAFIRAIGWSASRRSKPSLTGLLDFGQILGYYPTDQPTLLQLVGELSTEGNGGAPIEATNLIDAVTASLSADLGALKPLVDTALTLGITIPEYDANAFVDGLESGNLLAAIGDPIAAGIGQIPFIIGFDGLLPLLEAPAIDISEFASLMS